MRSRHLATSAYLIILAGACRNSPPVQTPEVDTPKRQFVFEGVHFEERRGERIIWRGTGRRADGDLSEAWVEDVKLHCAGQSAKLSDFIVRSPRAHLEFDNGLATFDDVHIVDAEGGTLKAKRARYEETHGHVLAEGPLRFDARGLTASAASAVILLDDGIINIAGPVHGEYEQPEAR